VAQVVRTRDASHLMKCSRWSTVALSSTVNQTVLLSDVSNDRTQFKMGHVRWNRALRNS
jgi:hypothetical protein